jgi:hypothetical protein
MPANIASEQVLRICKYDQSGLKPRPRPGERVGKMTANRPTSGEQNALTQQRLLAVPKIPFD